MDLYPKDQPFPIDIAQAFWAGLCPDIQDQATSTVPPYQLPPHPLGEVETNEAASCCLHEVKTAASQFECQIQQVCMTRPSS